LGDRLEVFVPVQITVPWDLLDERDEAALEKLYLAARVIDRIFLEQVSAENIDLKMKLERQGDPDAMRFFRINFGPWDRLEGNEPVIGDAEKPAGANFYPADMTAAEFEDWVESHPDDKASFESWFTVIRRRDDGGLYSVPYSRQYRELLGKAAGYLREAADLVSSVTLAGFLRERADAFSSNDYFESDMAWMDVKDNVLDVTIGPYEVYEDELFNYKAAFEAFICVRDPAESRRLDDLKGRLMDMEGNLPIDDKHKNLNRGFESPISVVDEVFAGGDTKAGVQTLAFNLPNDERVREAKGSKKVMLRNICRAKFDKILEPISDRLISPGQRRHVTFEAYFNHILLHEFSHGLGPGRIVLEDGTETLVNRALRETYSAIEEAKADVVGQHNFYYLIDEEFYPHLLEKETAVTFLAGFFRSVRFGIGEAHGLANMIAFNYFREKRAYVQDASDGRWAVDFDRIRGAVEDLSHELLMLQALGDYDGSKRFIERYGKMDDVVRESISRIEDVPIDIEPRYELDERYAGVRQ